MRDAIIGAAILTVMGVTWAFAYVIPNDAHRDRVMECMGTQTSPQAYRACHNQNLHDAEGLVPLLHPEFK